MKSRPNPCFRLFFPLRFFLFCVLFLSLFATVLCGCRKASPKPLDFSSHQDGTPLSAAETAAYKESVLSSLIVTHNINGITGAHTNLFSTVVSVTLYDTDDEQLLRDCFALLAEKETILSRTLCGSELYCLNHHKAEEAVLSEDLAAVFSLGLSMQMPSAGKFDLSVAPLCELWNFSSDHVHRPTDSAIADALKKTGSSRISLSGNVLHNPDARTFDVGAIAKGYMADCLSDFLKSRGVASALINLGGNVLTIGSKPDGASFRIGIKMPFSSGEMAGTVEIQDLSVVTSGIYERCFVEDNVLYHHLLDATTGLPASGNLLSVTVVCRDSALADTLSTVLFLLGREKGTALVEELSLRLPIYALFLSGDYDPSAQSITNLSYDFTDGFEEALHFQR